MKFRYNNEKNAILEVERRVEFEDIIDAITNGYLISTEAHHNQKKYPNQELMYVRIKEEVYVVPFIEESDGAYFMKTLYPSRKARKKFPELKEKKKNANNDPKRSPT